MKMKYLIPALLTPLMAVLLAGCQTKNPNVKASAEGGQGGQWLPLDAN